MGSLTIPGQPSHLHEAREFVAHTLGDGCACSETAVLLTSELVTNSVQHSDSRLPGGTVTIALISVPGGIRIEVIDDGGTALPAVRQHEPEGPDFAEDGRGLWLIESLSARWSYFSDTAGTVTWFELAEQLPQVRSSCRTP
jgi:anti-sigma regulatory factor (Ser/Thr protein kinase)